MSRVFRIFVWHECFFILLALNFRPRCEMWPVFLPLYSKGFFLTYFLHGCVGKCGRVCFLPRLAVIGPFPGVKEQNGVIGHLFASRPANRIFAKIKFSLLVFRFPL